MKITTTKLSKEDIKLIKSDNPTNYLIVSVALLLFFFLIYNIYHEEPTFSKQDWDNIFILILAGLFFGCLLFYAVNAIIKTQKDVANGQKEVLMGILTDKNSYYFYFDNEKIAIKDANSRLRRNSSYHDNIGEIGQTIAIERSIYTKTILKVEVLKEIE